MAVITDYARSWRLFEQYDGNRFPAIEKHHQVRQELDPKRAEEAVATLKTALAGRGEATSLFGQDSEHRLSGIIGAVQQSFDGQML